MCLHLCPLCGRSGTSNKTIQQTWSPTMYLALCQPAGQPQRQAQSWAAPLTGPTGRNVFAHWKARQGRCTQVLPGLKSSWRKCHWLLDSVRNLGPLYVPGLGLSSRTPPAWTTVLHCTPALLDCDSLFRPQFPHHCLQEAFPDPSCPTWMVSLLLLLILETEEGGE